jgi:NAD(P)H-flavin reductase/formate hydrogenlyase subunit 6/NADH:ubiquinone oxidoreductase subunit I
MVITAGNVFLPRERLDALFDLLHEGGRTIIGPSVRDGMLVLDRLERVEDLPIGWRDEQSPGRYRLVQGATQRAFDVVNGQMSWKQFTFPPKQQVGTMRRDASGSVAFAAVPPDPPRLAFLGVRACELAALGIQDRVLAGGTFVDEDYRARRESALVVAVQCTRAGDACFCASMGTGPEVRGGHDLVMTELDAGFVVSAGSPAGERLLARLPGRIAAPAEEAEAAAEVAAVRAAQGDPVVIEGLRDRLMDQLDSPRWAEVAERCLACANCTMVCPTCFCTSTAITSDLDGHVNVAERQWDSCFNAGFAKVAGGNFRPERSDRYRQWLTHKFATWVDQFGTYGCVGCARCITWCPVGIDVREELAAIAPPAAPPEQMLTRPAAATPGRFEVVTLRASRRETADTTSLFLQPTEPALLAGLPGQFVMVEQPGFPSLPISVSRYGTDELVLTVRAAGPATTALIAEPPGAQIGLRGPLGRPWPVDRALGRNVLIVTGGIGLAPLRPVLDAIVASRDRFGDVLLAYGARTPSDRLFTDELETWPQHGIEVAQIVDRAEPGWEGRVGVVTQLLDRRDFGRRPTVAFVCGPERMMQATVTTLRDRGVAPERLFVSMERHMQCGIGLCGHCQLGPYFVCRDGPVFSVGELGELFGKEGL